ncbi:hypothetical protein Btru_027193 [Bulinus truncatus]|nr:hypothetical protein Btru_027193 [Bulinus truncatus]
MFGRSALWSVKRSAPRRYNCNRFVLNYALLANKRLYHLMYYSTICEKQTNEEILGGMRNKGGQRRYREDRQRRRTEKIDRQDRKRRRKEKMDTEDRQRRQKEKTER